MEELINKVAEEQGITAELVERSAHARAAAKGVAVEALLTEWAGGEAAVAGPAPEPAEPAADRAAADPAPAEPEAEAPEEPVGPQVEVLGPSGDDEETGGGEEPEGDEADTGEAPPEEEPRPGVMAGFPRWLAAAFVVVPTVALLYAMLAPDGPDCGVSGQLDLDPVTGVAVNCDGSAYGVEQVDFFATGEEIYASRCAACHGDGGGGGTGPALAGGAVLATFPGGSCDAHREWVSLGTSEFPEDTYGALARPVGGGGEMPGFSEEVAGAAGLSDEDIAAVVLYERVNFGDQPLPEAEEECIPAEDGEEEAVTASS